MAVNLLAYHYQSLRIHLDPAELLGYAEHAEAGLDRRKPELLERLLFRLTALYIALVELTAGEKLVDALKQQLLLLRLSEIHASLLSPGQKAGCLSLIMRQTCLPSNTAIAVPIARLPG